MSKQLCTSNKHPLPLEEPWSTGLSTTYAASVGIAAPALSGCGCVCQGDEPKRTADPGRSTAWAWDSPLDHGLSTDWKCLGKLHCCSVCHSNFEMPCTHIDSLCVYCCTSLLECVCYVCMCPVSDSRSSHTRPSKDTKYSLCVLQKWFILVGWPMLVFCGSCRVQCLWQFSIKEIILC